MMQLVEANWLAVVLALVVGLLVAWWVFGRAAKPVERTHRPDVLDEGAAPARRNQALIDAPSAAAAAKAAPVTPPASELMGGIGQIIGAAVHEEAVQAAAAAVPAASTEDADDLTRIKGLGPKLAALLAGLGVTSFAQIAAWSEADLIRVDSQLGTFAGRPARDQWIAQAKLLAAGDTAAYEAQFGKH